MNKAAATLHFTEVLLTLIRGKTSLFDSLNILSGEGINKQVRESAISLLYILKKGKTLSEGLEILRAGKVLYSPLYLTLIKSGEVTGNIEAVMERIVIDLNRKKNAKSNIINILIYPLLIILLAIAGTFLIIFKGIPLFILGGFISPNSVTEMIFGVILAGLVLISGAGLIFMLYFRIFNNDSPEYRIFYLLDMLLLSHVTLPEALIHCIQSFGKGKIARNLTLIKKEISRGISFSNAFSKVDKISPYVLGWLQVADKHGNLSEICKYIKNYYEEKDRKQREIASKLIEPLIIILTGIYLLIIIVNVILPILTLTGGIL